MKHLLKPLLWVCLLTVVSCRTAGPTAEHQTVSLVDLERYQGKWYDIASFPTWFQKDCYCVTAEYTLREDMVEVRNSCRKGSPTGKLDVATAKARPVPGTGNSKLKVQFFWPFKGDYWIIALDEDYRWALVGHPKRTYLWVLSRSPRIEESLYQALLEKAMEKGYNVARLRKTDQSCYP